MNSGRRSNRHAAILVVMDFLKPNANCPDLAETRSFVRCFQEKLDELDIEQNGDGEEASPYMYDSSEEKNDKGRHSSVTCLSLFGT